MKFTSETTTADLLASNAGADVFIKADEAAPWEHLGLADGKFYRNGTLAAPYDLLAEYRSAFRVDQLKIFFFFSEVKDSHPTHHER